MNAEKVKTVARRRQKKQAESKAKDSPKLERTTFVTSRQMDFFSEKELTTQTGHQVEEWPLVFLKETIDNALDACEEADAAPVITVTADECGITVKDNGPGLPESTLESALDFSVRASNREAYVAPDRGAQGNAMKTLLPMPRVIDPEGGKLIIAASGQRHVLTCGADPISQFAAINDDAEPTPTSGTLIRIEWTEDVDDDGDVMWPFDSLFPREWEDDARQDSTVFFRRVLDLVEGFAIFNPHASISLDWFGHEDRLAGN